MKFSLSVIVLPFLCILACSEGTDPIAMGGGGSSSGGSSSPSGGAESTGGSASGGAASGGTASGGQGSDIEFPFDADTDGFNITYEEGLGMGGTFSSSLEHDATKGSPTPGALKLNSPTDDQAQKVFVGHNLETPLDLTGKVLSAKLQLASGLGTNEECPGGTYVYAKSGNEFKFARGAWQNLTESGTFIDVSLALAAPDYADDGFEPSDIREIGITVNTSEGCTGAAFSPVVAYIDSFDY